MAIWELSRSMEQKPSAAVEQETGERGGGWWELLPRQGRSCAWLFLGALAVLSLSPRDGCCDGVLHITPPGLCVQTVLQSIIHMDGMQPCSFHYHHLCRILMLGLFFLPPIIPETWTDSFVSLTTVSSGLSTIFFPFWLSFCHHPTTRNLYPLSLFFFTFFHENK